MHLVVTAGHVDHGKTSLVDSLTGMNADRLPEEKARAMSIDLGYVWTELPGVGTVAFVDVPGHERFIGTAIAGIAPGGSAALLAVAADDPWMPQAAEHLQVLDALGYQDAVVAVTRCDLADPRRIHNHLDELLSHTSLAGAPVVDVSIKDSGSMARLREALVTVLTSMQKPSAVSDARMWVDRTFIVKGVGRVVTGTLAAGRIDREDRLSDGVSELRVRGVQALGAELPYVVGPARVALNLVGEATTHVRRGSVLFRPDAWCSTTQVDIAVQSDASSLPRTPLVHVGTAMVQARARIIGPRLVRITLPAPMPLRVGDRVIVRDPGTRRLWGGTVLDPAPPQFHKRGDAGRRADELEREVQASGPSWKSELRRRRVVHSSFLRQIGVPLPDRENDNVVVIDEYLMTEVTADEIMASIRRLVTDQAACGNTDGLTVDAIVSALDLPSTSIINGLLVEPVHGGEVVVANGRIRLVADEVRRYLEAAVARLAGPLPGVDKDGSAFVPLTHESLRAAGISEAQVVEAVELGVLARISDDWLLPLERLQRALQLLEPLPQPFTVSQARTALAVSRKIAFSILGSLEQRNLVGRGSDDRRTVLSTHLI